MNWQTVIIINGTISEPFKVSRGVRQGDPLSCLLFNLAIEPLANSIRKSNINGYQIPGLDDSLKTLPSLLMIPLFSSLNQIAMMNSCQSEDYGAECPRHASMPIRPK
jgi:hypothetical protein